MSLTAAIVTCPELEFASTLALDAAGAGAGVAAAGAVLGLAAAAANIGAALAAAAGGSEIAGVLGGGARTLACLLVI